MLWLLRTKIQQNEPINEYSDSFTKMKNNEIYMLWKITIPIDFQINLSIWKPIIWMFLVYALWAHMVVMREKNMCIVNLLSFIITNSLYRYNYRYSEVNPLVPKSSL